MAQVHGAGNGIPVLDAAQYNCLLRSWMLNILVKLRLCKKNLSKIVKIVKKSKK